MAVCQDSHSRRRGNGCAAVPADRRAVHESPLLWKPADGDTPGGVGLQDQPQARTAADETDGAGGHGAGAAHQSTPSWAQGVSVSAAGVGHRTAQPGLEYGHHLPSPGPRVCVSGGDPGLVQPQGLGVGLEQQPRGKRRLFGISGGNHHLSNQYDIRIIDKTCPE